MTLREAGELLGIRPGTLRQQIANGRLRARKVGRDWTVTPSEVERYRSTSRGHPGRPSRGRPAEDGAGGE
jgi:excisionase family DNA binding protein